MSSAERPQDDVFLPGGRIRPGRLAPAAAAALDSAIRLARETRWDSVRSPHIFMGLLAVPDPGVRVWGDRIGADRQASDGIGVYLARANPVEDQASDEQSAFRIEGRHFAIDVIAAFCARNQSEVAAKDRFLAEKVEQLLFVGVLNGFRAGHVLACNVGEKAVKRKKLQKSCAAEMSRLPGDMLAAATVLAPALRLIMRCSTLAQVVDF